VEGFFQDAFSQGITGALSGQKKSFKEVGQTIVQSMILELNKKSFTRIWDEIAKKLAPGTKSTSGGGLTGAGLTGAGGAASQKITKLEQQAAAGSVKAAKELQEAAAEHKDAAGGLGLSAKEHETAAGGLSLSGVSLGLSAGGLLLSGIGIATNSQFLVYAGTALQLVAMAIEVAQMLAAGSLTGSAGALDAAAIALMAAAAVDAATFWHTGGLVAHSGLLVAHDGLAVDERRAIVQTGEGIIKRDTMAEYARQGISFDMLNTGRLPVLPVPAPFAAGNSRGATPDRFQAEVPVNLTMVSPEGKILSRRQERQVITLVRKYKGYGEL
jgi:hypothetical protein